MFDHRNVEKSRTLSHLKALDGTAGTPPGQPQLHEDASRTQGGGTGSDTETVPIRD